MVDPTLTPARVRRLYNPAWITSTKFYVRAEQSEYGASQIQVLEGLQAVP